MGLEDKPHIGVGQFGEMIFEIDELIEVVFPPCFALRDAVLIEEIVAHPDGSCEVAVAELMHDRETYGNGLVIVVAIGVVVVVDLVGFADLLAEGREEKVEPDARGLRAAIFVETVGLEGAFEAEIILAVAVLLLGSLPDGLHRHSTTGSLHIELKTGTIVLAVLGKETGL